MKQIQAKIYYDVYTGDILTITTECKGDVEETNKEQDMGIYPQLQDKNIEDVDYIELPYGTLSTTFNNAKSYSINLETRTLDCIYYTEEELMQLNTTNNNTSNTINLESQVETLQDNIIDLKYENLILKGE